MKDFAEKLKTMGYTETDQVESFGALLLYILPNFIKGLILDQLSDEELEQIEIDANIEFINDATKNYRISELYKQKTGKTIQEEVDIFLDRILVVISESKDFLSKLLLKFLKEDKTEDEILDEIEAYFTIFSDRQLKKLDITNI